MQEENKTQEIDILFIQCKLGLREIIKLENNTIFSDDDLQRYADTYKLGNITVLLLSMGGIECIFIRKDVSAIRNSLYDKDNPRRHTRVIHIQYKISCSQTSVMFEKIFSYYTATHGSQNY